MPGDKRNFVTFLRNLRKALDESGSPSRLGLSITIPSSYWYMRNFDIVSIDPIVDWFNIMTYDLHGTWDSTDSSIGAIAQAHTNLTEINTSLNLLWRNHINPAKGLPRALVRSRIHADCSSKHGSWFLWTQLHNEKPILFICWVPIFWTW